jgi:hypothetical protein
LVPVPTRAIELSNRPSALHHVPGVWSAGLNRIGDGRHLGNRSVSIVFVIDCFLAAASLRRIPA